METKINVQTRDLSYAYASKKDVQALSDFFQEHIDHIDRLMDTLKEYVSANDLHATYLRKSIKKLHTINTIQSIAIVLLSIALILHLIGG